MRTYTLRGQSQGLELRGQGQGLQNVSLRPRTSSRTPPPHKFPLQSQIFLAVTYPTCSHKSPLQPQITLAVANSPCSHKFPLLSQILPAVTKLQIPPAVTNSAFAWKLFENKRPESNQIKIKSFIILAVIRRSV